jgi:predicted alpha/beta superfamily hydrolase
MVPHTRSLIRGAAVAAAALVALAMVALVARAGLHWLERPGPIDRTPSARPNVAVLPEPLAMPGLDRSRTLRLRLPRDYATGGERRYPVIYMHDGQNLFDNATSGFGEWQVDETLDALSASHGFEAIVVGIDSVAELRRRELTPYDYAPWGKSEGEAYLAFVVGTVKPYIDAHYRTLPDRSHTAIFGSSLGGLMSHYAMHRYPEVFARAGVFSPAYWAAPQLFEYARTRPLPADARLYFYMGGREGGSYLTDVKRMVAEMRERPPGDAGIELKVARFAIHEEAAWARAFADAVIWMFELEPRRGP